MKGSGRGYEVYVQSRAPSENIKKFFKSYPPQAYPNDVTTSPSLSPSLTQPTFISGGQSMGASRPPHSIADTLLGGPAQPTSAPQHLSPCLLEGVGHSTTWPRPLVSA